MKNSFEEIFKGSILKEISKDVIYYIPAQLIPGLCGFIAIAIYIKDRTVESNKAQFK